MIYIKKFESFKIDTFKNNDVPTDYLEITKEILDELSSEYVIEIITSSDYIFTFISLESDKAEIFKFDEYLKDHIFAYVKYLESEGFEFVKISNLIDDFETLDDFYNSDEFIIADLIIKFKRKTS